MALVDDLLTGLPSDQTDTESGIVGGLIDGSANDSRLRVAMDRAAQANPDNQARVLKAQMRTGLPADLIERNLDAVEREQARADFDPAKFRKTSPVFASWLAENPAHAALVKDDMDGLGQLEQAWNAAKQGFRKGGIQDELGGLNYQMLTGVLTPEQEARRSELKAQMHGTELSAPDPVDYFINQTAYTGRQLISSVREGVKGGIAGAVGAGGAVALAGQLGPQVAIPEEVITVPTAAGLGGRAGYLAGSAVYSYQQEAGFAYDEFREIKDFQGQPLDEDTARGAAIAVGLINAALDTAGDAALASTLPGLRDVLQGGARRSIKALLARPTARAALAEAGKRWVAAAGIEGTTEALQELNTILGRELAQFGSGQNFKDDNASADASRVLQAGMAAFVGALGVGAPGSAVNFATDLSRVRQAQKDQAFITALGQNAKDSKLRGRLPEKYQEFVERLTKDGAVDRIGIPVEKFTELFQSEGVDPADIATEIFGTPKEYMDALAAGSDLWIPLEAYASKLAGSDYHARLIKDLRLRDGSMTAREAEEWQKNAPSIAEDIAKELNDSRPANDTSAPVFDDVFAQLTASGTERSAAERQATFTQAIWRTLGARMGQDPMALYQRYGLRVQRPVPDALKKAAEVDTVIDPLIDRLRAGDIPSQSEAFGQSLLDFIRSKGGLSDDGGELSARDAQLAERKGERLARRLVQKEGRSLDDMAEIAVEAGYLTDRDPAALLARIDEELADKPQFAAGRENRQVQEIRENLTQLEEFLGRAGVDIKTADNAAVRRALAGEAAQQRAADDAGTTLDQKRKGSITFGRDRQFTINFFDNDLSTFLHESGHFYLEVLGDLAEAADAPPQIVADYAAILKWFGVESRQAIGTEQHELFARGFEAYLMEGKAPSPSLVGVFARFRAWLLSIYKSVSRLNVEINDEVRGIFDRLVATDTEIEAARQSQALQGLIGDEQTATALGMSSAEFASYREAVVRAKEDAGSQVATELARAWKREEQAWWKERKATVEEEVEREVNRMPVYRAMSMMQRQTEPDGSALPEHVRPVKLSRAALVDMYGAEFLKRLPRPYVYSKEGGAHPDLVAGMYGFDSGDALVKALIEAQPRAALIKAETDARMREQFPDPLTDGSLAERAMHAAHNDRQADVMMRELKALNRTAGIEQPTALQIVKAAAKRIIGQQRVRDIRPETYRLAEAKAGKLALEAALSGGIETASVEKRRQILNHELYREAVRTKEEAQAAVDYLRKFGRDSARKKIGKVGGDYLGQIDGLLERFSLSRVSLAQIDKQKALAAWVAEQEAAGLDVVIDDALLNEARRVSYQEMAAEDLLGLRDTIKNIEHLANLKSQLLSKKDKRDLQEAADALVASIEAHHKLKDEVLEFAPNWRKRLKDFTGGFFAEHTKMEFLFTWLDGEQALGEAWRTLFKPLADAEHEEAQLMRVAKSELDRLFGAYTKAERAKWSRKFDVPELGASFTKASLISMAFNMGNAYNREVMVRGYAAHGWTEAKVQAVLDRMLDKRDWDTVQGIWDHINSYWPAIAQMQRDLTGLEPEKVEALEVKTKFGTYAGGYYPIKYDAELSWRQSVQDEKQNVTELFGGNFMRPQTRKGHTQARTDSGGKPVLLDLSVLTGHVTNVIHDLTHRRPVMDVDRLVQHPAVRDAIQRSAGRQMYKQLRPWLQGIAGDYRQPGSKWEAILNRARMGAAVVNMGWKITTAIVQPLGYLQTVDHIGPKYAALGLKRFYGNPLQMKARAEWAMSKSEQLRGRQRTFDRDVRDTLKALSPGGRIEQAKVSFFYLTGLMDMSVSVPGWLGAYQKAIDGAVDGVPAGDDGAAIDYADSVLRMSQSSGAAKDLSEIQRGQVSRLFTVFYSYFNALYNLFARRIGMTRSVKDMPRFAASMFMLWFVPAILSEMVSGRGPGEDEEPEDWLSRTWYIWALYPLNSIVGIRDMVSALGPYGYDASPLFDAFEQTMKAVSRIGANATEDEEFDRDDVKAALLASSYWLGLPGRQTWITGSYLYDWMTGQDEPEDWQEAVRNIAFARPPQN